MAKIRCLVQLQTNAAFGTGKLLALDPSSFVFVLRTALEPCTGICLDQAEASQKHWKWRDFSHHAHSPPFQSPTMKPNGHVTIKILAEDQIDFCSQLHPFHHGVPTPSGEQRQQGNHPAEISLGLLHGAGHKLSGRKITVSFKSKFPACVNLNEIPFQESI